MERNNEDERRGLIERGEETMNETARKPMCIGEGTKGREERGLRER